MSYIKQSHHPWPWNPKI
uniref:Uncharacterized protein n=1 Tax=Rhizophora mucronata TaxID=61149 RepID=A0A2P2Q241_RHIMU